MRVTTDRCPLDRVYTGCAPPRESGFGRGLVAIGLVLAGLASGGCSISMPLTGLTSGEPQATGGIEPKTAASVLSPELGDEDWRRAKGALAIALDPQGNGSAVNWDNPETTLKGNFVPVGRPFVKADEICRAFLATITGQQASTSSLQGTACRPSGGDWTIKETKPWHKPA